MKVLRATRALLPEIAVLFDQYRQFYGQKGDVDGAETFLKERLERRESVIFLAKNRWPSGWFHAALSDFFVRFDGKILVIERPFCGRKF